LLISILFLLIKILDFLLPNLILYSYLHFRLIFFQNSSILHMMIIFVLLAYQYIMITLRLFQSFFLVQIIDFHISSFVYFISIYHHQT
jgi:hypothetical protein